MHILIHANLKQVYFNQDQFFVRQPFQRTPVKSNFIKSNGPGRFRGIAGNAGNHGNDGIIIIIIIIIIINLFQVDGIAKILHA